MLQPPATFLPAGGSTTFTLTYVYNLRNNEDYAQAHGGQGSPNYRDTFYITSTSHPNATRGATNQDHPAADGSYEYLLDFDAQFEVSKSPLHKVTVIYKPTNGNMGTAGLIVGEQDNGTDKVMNYTTTTQTFAKDKKVYVVANLVDEYEIKSVTIDDGHGNQIVVSGQPLTIVDYTGTSWGGDPSLVKEGTKIYAFRMPDQDVTVTVNFYEPLYSKLRLSNLIEFSANQTADLRDVTKPGEDYILDENDIPAEKNTYRVWRKTFTQAERDAAAAWQLSSTGGNGASPRRRLSCRGLADGHDPSGRGAAVPPVGKPVPRGHRRGI